MARTDRGWKTKDASGPVRYFWAPFNQGYGTWYRLEAERKGLKTQLTVASGKGAEVTVQPDMEPGRWYWSVRVGLSGKTKEKTKWGSAPTSEAAMAEAQRMFTGWGDEET